MTLRSALVAFCAARRVERPAAGRGRREDWTPARSTGDAAAACAVAGAEEARARHAPQIGASGAVRFPTGTDDPPAHSGRLWGRARLPVPCEGRHAARSSRAGTAAVKPR